AVGRWNGTNSPPAEEVVRQTRPASLIHGEAWGARRSAAESGRMGADLRSDGRGARLGGPRSPSAWSDEGSIRSSLAGSAKALTSPASLECNARHRLLQGRGAPSMAVRGDWCR